MDISMGISTDISGVRSHSGSRPLYARVNPVVV
jgi:hypothetical protein